MNLDLLPYLFLFIAILVGWISTPGNSLFALVLAIAAGLFAHRLDWVSLFSIVLLGLSLWLPTRLENARLIKSLSYSIFLMLAIAMSNYLVPGFNNLPIYESVRFSRDSAPFSMYLNFDKTLVGLFVILFFKRTSIRDLRGESILTALAALTFLVAAMMPIALAIHYVHVDIKFPELGWIWVLNNLFFVCVAEEGLFRGFIQGGLEGLLPKGRIYSAAAVITASFLFGLAHYKGGLAYVALAGIAGLIYGYVFQQTKRLEASIMVHFGLNFVHFLFFSYPSLVK